VFTHALSEERSAEEESGAVSFGNDSVQSLPFRAIQQRHKSEIRCLQADQSNLD
jgi:hypothetical protein